MSFDELLEHARSQPNHEQMTKGLMFIVYNKNTYNLAQFIEPFLSHVASEHLNLFHNYLLNRQPYHIIADVIYNMLNECRTNAKLIKVLEVTLQKHL